MSERAIHYAGALYWRDRRGGSVDIAAGYAACCTGARARQIAAAGENTYDRAEVTCKLCLRALDRADATAFADIMADKFEREALS